MKFRAFILSVATVCGSLCLTLCLLEFGFRFLPVHDSLRALPVTSGDPIARFEPNRNFTFSSGWNFNVVNRGRVNGAGWVNDQEYEVAHRSPLLAVVGDSFIEALMVPYGETIQGRLAKLVAGRGRVYSFGMSRSALSQYLVYARHAREVYGADAIVINVVGNDFDESLFAYDTDPWDGRLHHYEEDPQGNLRLARHGDYRPSRVSVFFRQFALARYLFLNLQAGETFRQLVRRVSSLLNHLDGPVASAAPVPSQFISNTSASIEGRRLSLSRRAIDAFFRDLPIYTKLPKPRVLLLVDGVRPQLYSSADLASVQGSFVVLMRKYFLQKAGREGYPAIDLEPLQIAKFRRDGLKFEFPTDLHWNGNGHSVAAQAVANSPMFDAVLGRTSPEQ